MNTPFVRTGCLVALACVAACSKPDATTSGGVPGAPGTSQAAIASAPADAHATNNATNGIAWRHASSDAEVDAAFQQARADAKPVFLYWGASWCPPCNQVKATLFNRQDFIERSRAFVPVYVDGDSKGAQKLGARFHVSGYPTMLLFAADGTEVTRVPGEVDPARYTELVTLGMNAKRPVKAVLADALAGGRGLGANDWRLLAFYAWDTDEQQVVPRAELPALLQRLAAACPASEAETATRLRLKALAAADTGRPADPAPGPNAPTAADAGAADRLVALLDDPAAARPQFDVLANNAADLVRAASVRGTPARQRLQDAFDRAMRRFETDASLSRADRLGALIARVDLAKVDRPKDPDRAASAPTGAPPSAASAPLDAALLDDVRAHAARVDREVTDGYERQAVITAAAYGLQEAGLGAESDALLTANLARSHSPYYLMSQLAGNAKKRGDAAAALRWSEEAYAKSQGPATRLQWGASYVTALVDLAPADDARIEAAARSVFAEAATQPDAFYERSGRSLERIGAKLAAWNADGRHGAALGRVQKALDDVCAGLEPGQAPRARCERLLKAAPAKAA